MAEPLQVNIPWWILLRRLEGWILRAKVHPLCLCWVDLARLTNPGLDLSNEEILENLEILCTKMCDTLLELVEVDKSVEAIIMEDGNPVELALSSVWNVSRFNTLMANITGMKDLPGMYFYPSPGRFEGVESTWTRRVRRLAERTERLMPCLLHLLEQCKEHTFDRLVGSGKERQRGQVEQLASLTYHLDELKDRVKVISDVYGRLTIFLPVA